MPKERVIILDPEYSQIQNKTIISKMDPRTQMMNVNIKHLLRYIKQEQVQKKEYRKMKIIIV